MEKNQIEFIILAIIVIIYLGFQIFNPTNRVRNQIALFGEFPDWRNIDTYKGVITVSAHMGYKNNPDSVKVWEFNVKEKTATFYTNLTEGQEVTFEGNLKEGMSRVLKNGWSNFFVLLWSIFKTFATGLIMIASGLGFLISSFYLYIFLETKNFDRVNAKLFNNYPFWYEYTGESKINQIILLIVLSLALFTCIIAGMKSYYALEKK
jgi:hypothetical protein